MSTTPSTSHWIGGYSDFRFKRSFYLGALCKDREVKESYDSARHGSKMANNRSKVMFLGDSRTGKTSLRRLLTGEAFQPNEPSTEGIETKMCESKEVDGDWKEREKNRNEFEEAASWHTAKSILKLNPTTKDVNMKVFSTPKNLPKDLLIFVKYLFPIVTVFIIQPYQGFVIPFVFLEWIINLPFLLWTGELLFSYRYGTGVAMSIAFDVYFRHQLQLGFLMANLETLSLRSTFVSSVMFCVVILVLSFAMGVSMSMGFRHGIAFVLCLFLSPDILQIPSGLEWPSAFNIDGFDWHWVVDTFLARCGYFLSIVVQQYIVTTKRSSLIGAVCCMVVFGFILQTLNGTFPFVITFLYGVLFGIGLDITYPFNYWVNRTVGICIGCFAAYCMGWKIWCPQLSVLSLFIYLFSALSHPLIDLYIFLQVRHVQVKQNIPIVRVRDAMIEHAKGATNLPMTLSLWDFAGEKLYYFTHHIFLAKHAIYLLVFNMKDAIVDRKAQLQRIVFWLQSIFVHSKHKDSVVFLVGTHRDSIEKSDVVKMSKYLDKEIKKVRKFYDRVVVNGSTQSHLFPIENSKPLDSDAENLRNHILKFAHESENVQEEIPLNFLQFYETIQQKRKEGQKHGLGKVFCRYKDVLELVLSKHKDWDEHCVKAMLIFFHNAGEIIYRSDDDDLGKIVIFDPQFLIDVMKNFLQVPVLSEIPVDMKSSWCVLEEKGCVDSRLMKNLASLMGLSSKQLASLLMAFDLICPVPGPPYDNVPIYIVPYLLPDHSTKHFHWWVSNTDDDTFYFDFEDLLPSIVFPRLLARCINSSKVVDLSVQTDVFSDTGFFSFHDDITFKLEIKSNPPNQNLIKVTVQRAPGSNSREFLTWLITQINAIRNRDFQYLKYTFGVQCPLQHNGDMYGKRLHIIKLAASDQELIQEDSLSCLCMSRKLEIEYIPKIVYNTMATTQPCKEKQD